jgi:hypothetical protein
MAYILGKYIMVIIETSVFTRRVTALLSDDEYRELQATLVEHPKAGPVIPGSCGIRKIKVERIRTRQAWRRSSDLLLGN